MHTNKEIGANPVKVKANRDVGGIIRWQAGQSRAEARKEINGNASNP